MDGFIQTETATRLQSVLDHYIPAAPSSSVFAHDVPNTTITTRRSAPSVVLPRVAIRSGCLAKRGTSAPPRCCHRAQGQAGSQPSPMKCRTRTLHQHLENAKQTEETQQPRHTTPQPQHSSLTVRDSEQQGHMIARQALSLRNAMLLDVRFGSHQSVHTPLQIHDLDIAQRHIRRSRRGFTDRSSI